MQTRKAGMELSNSHSQRLHGLANRGGSCRPTVPLLKMKTGRVLPSTVVNGHSLPVFTCSLNLALAALEQFGDKVPDPLFDGVCRRCDYAIVIARQNAQRFNRFGCRNCDGAQVDSRAYGRGCPVGRVADRRSRSSRAICGRQRGIIVPRCRVGSSPRARICGSCH
jgi:hypothetical protein